MAERETIWNWDCKQFVGANCLGKNSCNGWKNRGRWRGLENLIFKFCVRIGYFTRNLSVKDTRGIYYAGDMLVAISSIYGI